MSMYYLLGVYYVLGVIFCQYHHDKNKDFIMVSYSFSRLAAKTLVYLLLCLEEFVQPIFA